jgi:CubicO group peptidase (beta-lactamase class C family)
MIHKVCFTVVLLAALLALGSSFPVLSQDGEITLVPFTDETFGVEGVIPEGWSEAGPGVYVRGEGVGDLTSLIIQAAPGMTAETLTGVLLEQLGIDVFPDSAGTQETDAYTWTLYEIGVVQAGMSIKVDLALTENETGVTLVLLQTLEDDYGALHEAVFLPVVQELAPIGAGTGEGEEAGEEVIYEDPAGRFSVPVPTNWEVGEREDYAFLYSPDELITVSILVIETDDPEEALAEAWAIVDPDFDKAIDETIEIPASTLEQFILYSYEMDDEEGLLVQVEVRVHEGLAYVLIFNADLTQAQQRQAQLQIIDSGFDIAAIEATDLSAVEPLPLTDDFIAEFEAYIETAMETYETPGVAVAIVRDGEIVYANGFGVRNPQGDPVTPETRMLIGSTTKTMTTLLMAQMVDDGAMDWETPVIEVLPTFAVADPEVTQAITMQNMVCACTGVPRRDLELVFNSDDLTAERIIESLSTFEFFTGFGEAFQYSNQMVAAGGYLTALAAGGEYGTLYDDYVNLLEEHIFTPLGMDSTTFSFEEVLASDNYAVPYGLYMDFSFEPLPFEVEEAFLVPITPAGAAWSTVLDLAKYMIMELNEGVAANGTRIVSAENLAHTWEPQIALSASDEYGLGWIVSDFGGLQMLSHAGNTLGFTAEFAFLPERNLGVVVLTNQRISFLNGAVRSRLVEMLFEQPFTADEAFQFSFNLIRDQYLEIRDQIERTAEPETTALAVGSFTNDALGDVRISLNHEGVLIFDAGEFQSELWLYTTDEEKAEEEKAVVFLLYDPPLNGLSIRFEPDGGGVYQMTLGGGVNEYTFERVE